jgi:hypothetical protein
MAKSNRVAVEPEAYQTRIGFLTSDTPDQNYYATIATSETTATNNTAVSSVKRPICKDYDGIGGDAVGGGPGRREDWWRRGLVWPRATMG